MPEALGPSESAASISNRQRDEDYSGVIAVLNDKWRVVRCRDGLNWIIQKASPSEWKSVKFHHNREHLIRRVRSLCGPVSDAAMAKLAALPDWISQTQGVAT